jgi:hypothetical protein
MSASTIVLKCAARSQRTHQVLRDPSADSKLMALGLAVEAFQYAAALARAVRLY